MNWRKAIIGVVALAMLGFGAFQGYLYSIHYYTEDPVFQTANGALDGYDAVSYFTEGGPTAGKPEHSLEWSGARWQFASAENLALFRASPERYAPQFGGYCAFAVGSGYTAKSDPQAWHVENGKLYLNFDSSVREQWMTRRAELIAAAQTHWPQVLKD